MGILDGGKTMLTTETDDDGFLDIVETADTDGGTMLFNAFNDIADTM